MKFKKKNMLLLFGTSTGNAYYLCNRVIKELRRRSINVGVYPCDSYDITQLFDAVISIFICSTSGEGDPPNTMKKFWLELMGHKTNEKYLTKLRFSFFSLGDSRFQKYNYIGHSLKKRLIDLGAKIIHYGLGDDQHHLGYEDEFQCWLKKILDWLEKKNVIAEKTKNSSN